MTTIKSQQASPSTSQPIESTNVKKLSSYGEESSSHKANPLKQLAFFIFRYTKCFFFGLIGGIPKLFGSDNKLWNKAVALWTGYEDGKNLPEKTTDLTSSEVNQNKPEIEDVDSHEVNQDQEKNGTVDTEMMEMGFKCIGKACNLSDGYTPDTVLFNTELLQTEPCSDHFVSLLTGNIDGAMEDISSFDNTAEPRSSLLFIPMIQQHSLNQKNVDKKDINHMAVLTVDLQRGEIEFYDPKGRAPECFQIAALGGMTVKTLVEEKILKELVHMNTPNFVQTSRVPKTSEEKLKKTIATKFKCISGKEDGKPHQSAADFKYSGAYSYKFMKERANYALLGVDGQTARNEVPSKIEGHKECCQEMLADLKELVGVE